MWKCFGDPKRLFPVRNHIFDHFKQNGRPYVEDSKSTKSQKNRFWPKIQILVEWPILAGMMIYGRKWVLKVF